MSKYDIVWIIMMVAAILAAVLGARDTSLACLIVSFNILIADMIVKDLKK